MYWKIFYLALLSAGFEDLYAMGPKTKPAEEEMK
jgi:hypothetical protein